MKSNNIINGFAWKLLERFGVQGAQFLLQIVLARILDPEHYGTLSLMIIFVNLANVFIQSGFNTALIQNKDVTEDDYSSIFWVSFGVAGLMYIILYIGAPFIATLYEIPYFVKPFRVLCLMLFPGALNSIQLAKISRTMDFKKVFVSSIAGTILSGVIGIIIAQMGGGLWALVAQTLLNVVVSCVVMYYTERWKPRMLCNFSRVKVLFSFGWKLLASGLLNTLYEDVRSLVIGVKYDSTTLGFYNRGKQFPQFIIKSINSSVQSVLLPAMSANQENTTEVKNLMRNSIMMSSYIIFPMMAGLAGIASPLVDVVLTEKWLPCVPYMQIYCFSLAFNPVHTSNLQAINAVGRSDIFLKLEIIKKTYGLVILIIALVFFDSPIAIALTGVVTTIVSCFVNALPNKKLIGYSYLNQMTDIFPSLICSIIMSISVMALGKIQMSSLMLMAIQIPSGVIIYIGMSELFKIKPYLMIKQSVINIIHSK